MKFFWFYLKAFFHGMAHPFDSDEQRLEYANREAFKLMRHMKF